MTNSSPLKNITVTILTKNSRKYLGEVLPALAAFDEIVIYDNGSTDDTVAFAKQFTNVSIKLGVFTGFGPTHNQASALAKHDWILSIDSDEVVTPELVEELSELNLNSKCVYSIPRKNFYNGKWIKWCGWHPDRQLRLYNRTETRFNDAQVHEAIQVHHMQVIPLKSSIKHYSYDSIYEFLSKMQSYSQLFAQQNVGKKKSSICKAILHGFFSFFKSYIIKRGFLGGPEGFIISAYNGHTAFYKYLKLREFNNKSDYNFL